MSIKTKIGYLLILLFGINSIVIAQDNPIDVVYLKNGSIIRGVIIEQVPNKSLKIQTRDNSVFVYNFEDIEKITKELTNLNTSKNNINNSGTIKRDNNLVEYKRKGFSNITTINYALGFGEYAKESQTYFSGDKNEDNSFGINTINGIQIDEHFFLGLGFGIDIYKSVKLVPITFNLKTTLLKGKTSPTINLSGGYSYGLDDAVGGPVFNGSIGIKTFLNEKIAFVLDIGYRMQEQKIEYYYNNYLRAEKFNFKFITVNTGFVF